MVSNSFKKYIILIFVIVFLIFNITSYAAIVSDNDGSVFVTKAEFDALKSSFNNQIQNYNDSIDNKIDGAIASYLAGIKIIQLSNEDSLLNRINSVATGGKKIMAKSWNPPITQLPYGGYLNFLFSFVEVAAGVNYAYSWARLGFDATSARYQMESKQYPTDATYKNGRYNMIKEGVYGKYLSGVYYKINYVDLITGLNAGTGSGSVGKATTNAWLPVFGMTDLTFSNDYWSIEAGVDFWPICFSDGVSSTASTNVPMTIGASYTIDDTVNYVVPVVGTATTINDSFLLEDDLPKMESQPHTFRWSPWYGYWYNYMSGTTKAFSGVTKYKEISYVLETSKGNTSNDCLIDFQQHPLTTSNLAALVDNNISETYGTAVRSYEGIPLCQSSQAGILTAQITFKNETTGCTDNIICAFRKNKFLNDGNYVHDTDLEITDDTGTSITSTEFEPNKIYTLKFKVKKNDYIWLKAYSKANDGYFVSAETSSITSMPE